MVIWISPPPLATEDTENTEVVGIHHQQSLGWGGQGDLVIWTQFERREMEMMT